MRLLEAIIEANHRAAAGDTHAGLHPDDFAGSLPLVALTCIDPRLNPLLPAVLGVPAEQFIWLRNAGNIITGPLSSTLRSLALACAVKGGREIAIIGHTDCLVCKTSMLELIERFRALGLRRDHLPDNLLEFFGVFASERQNVLKAVEIVRSSPVIGPKIPVHGLLVDISSGRVEWLVNGYQQPLADAAEAARQSAATGMAAGAGPIPLAPDQLPAFLMGEMKFPEGQIGESAAKIQESISRVEQGARRVEDAAREIEAMAEKGRNWIAGALTPGTPSKPLPPRARPKSPPPKLPPAPPPARPAGTIRVRPPDKGRRS